MRRWAAAAAVFLLLCGGCTQEPAGPEPAGEREEAERLSQIQLGILYDMVAETERERVVSLLEQVIPLRRAREEADIWEKTAGETRLVEQLNRLYERYTVKYVGSGGSWGYTSPTEQVLAEYTILPDNGLRPDLFAQTESSLFRETEYIDLWQRMCAILPEEAWTDFTKLIIFTDGPEEMLAYVYAMDEAGERWAIAVDPADAEDWDSFAQTVLHEYAHYLTLNSGQVEYTHHQRAAVYSEAGMNAIEGSYLNDFYLAFWVDYLDDRLANQDSVNFLLRHPEDFPTPYASSGPCEDIAECFAGFILNEPSQGGETWEQKLEFFYQYPELVRFREETRAYMGF